MRCYVDTGTAVHQTRPLGLTAVDTDQAQRCAIIYTVYTPENDARERCPKS